MRVGRVGHATLIIETRDIRCVMDPVFVDPFECGTNRFHPPVELDVEGIGDRFHLAILSHEHMDHFSIRSLDQLRRDRPILYPRGAGEIAFALEKLGFIRATPVDFGNKLEIQDLSITPTPSDVNFPEMGVLFQSGGRSFWNAVDSEIGDRAKSIVQRVAGQVDVLFTPFQPLIENELTTDALGQEFPYERYGAFLRNTLDIRPRCVVPGSCGFSYHGNDWQNHRGFPVTEEMFLADVRRMDPGITTRRVPHGGVMTITEGYPVQANGLGFASAVDPADPCRCEWRPDRGVPAVEDRNPFGHTPTHLRRTVGEYLDGPFLGALQEPARWAWLQRMTTLGVLWQLVIVYPNGASETRWLDFGADALKWSSTPGSKDWKLLTVMPASGIAGLIAGELDSYAGKMCRRVVCRMYEPTRWGATRVGNHNDDPLTLVLLHGADRRLIERELKLLGYMEDQGRDQRRPAVAAAIQ